MSPEDFAACAASTPGRASPMDIYNPSATHKTYLKAIYPTIQRNRCPMLSRSVYSNPKVNGWYENISKNLTVNGRMKMKRILAALILLAPGFTQAQDLDPLPNFLSDGWAFVPPNCLPFPFGPAGTVVTKQTLMPETNISVVSTILVEIRAWRIACSDGTTVIAMDFRNLSGVNSVVPGIDDLEFMTSTGKFSGASLVIVPTEFPSQGFPNDDVGIFWRNFGNLSAPLLLTRNTFESRFGLNPTNPPTIDDMQGEITLFFFNKGSIITTLSIPPASQLTSFPFFEEPPLTGRHSGMWVVEGSSDQGINLSVSELTDRRLFVFLTWFTYDQNGGQAWFSGGSFFTPGEHSVDHCCPINS